MTKIKRASGFGVMLELKQFDFTRYKMKRNTPCNHVGEI